MPQQPLVTMNALVLWTALSLALGLEIQGEIIQGLPCIKRLNQLFCPSAGNTYPTNRIDRFIDDNKALMRRMYGEFITAPGQTYPTFGSNNFGQQQSNNASNDSFFFNLNQGRSRQKRQAPQSTG